MINRIIGLGADRREPSKSRKEIAGIFISILIGLTGCDSAGPDAPSNRAVISIESDEIAELIPLVDSIQVKVSISDAPIGSTVQAMATIDGGETLHSQTKVLRLSDDAIQLKIPNSFGSVQFSGASEFLEYPVWLSARSSFKNQEVVSDSIRIIIRVLRDYFPLRVGAFWEYDYAYSHWSDPSDMCGIRGQVRDETGGLKWEVKEAVDEQDGSVRYILLESFEGTHVTNIPGEHCEGAFEGGSTNPVPFSWEREFEILENDLGLQVLGPDLIPAVAGPPSTLHYHNFTNVVLARYYSIRIDTVTVQQLSGTAPPQFASLEWTILQGVGPTRLSLRGHFPRNGQFDRTLKLRDFFIPDQE